MNIEQLKPDHWYRFSHKRKGTFYAIFRDWVKTQNDPVDAMKIKVDIWTEEGSGQERLAKVFQHIDGIKQRPKYGTRILRPSLLSNIELPGTKEQQRLLDIEKFEKPLGRERLEAMGDEHPGYVAPPKEKYSWVRRMLRRK